MDDAYFTTGGGAARLRNSSAIALISAGVVCASIGADTLGYISLAQLVEATTIEAPKLCTACFTGEYPIELPAPELLGKHMLEGISRVVEVEGGSQDPSPDTYEQMLPGVGAEDALQRP